MLNLLERLERRHSERDESERRTKRERKRDGEEGGRLISDRAAYYHVIVKGGEGPL